MDEWIELAEDKNRNLQWNYSGKIIGARLSFFQRSYPLKLNWLPSIQTQN